MTRKLVEQDEVALMFGMLPGSLINTSPTGYRVIEFMKLQRFNGKIREFV